jgi:hypothetical protein
MIDLIKRDAYAKKLVAAARSIVTYELSLPRGCQRVRRALDWLRPFEDELPTVFDDYLRAVSQLPIGKERLEWDRKVLKEKDRSIEAVTVKFRDAIFEASWTLIDRFDKD